MQSTVLTGNRTETNLPWQPLLPFSSICHIPIPNLHSWSSVGVEQLTPASGTFTKSHKSFELQCFVLELVVVCQVL